MTSLPENRAGLSPVEPLSLIVYPLPSGEGTASIFIPRSPPESETALVSVTLNGLPSLRTILVSPW